MWVVGGSGLDRRVQSVNASGYSDQVVVVCRDVRS